MSREFDKYEQRGAYHWVWYAENRHQYRDLVNRSMSYLQPPGSVVDVGCGDGLCAFELYKRGFEVHGIDTSKAAIAMARQAVPRAVFGETGWRFVPPSLRPLVPGYRRRLDELHGRVRFDVMSVADLPEKAYDQAFMQEVIEHIEDARGAVERLASVVRQFAIITTPNGEFMKKHELDYHHWNAEAFMQLFAGMTAELLHTDQRNLIVKLHAT